MIKSANQQELLNEIEAARTKMHKISAKKPMTSNEVVKISTELDELINKYQLSYYKRN